MTPDVLHQPLRRLILGTLFAGLMSMATAAHASAVAGLERFYRDVHTYSARFHQVVLDEALNPIQESSGTLWIDRPGRFRWDYDLPYRQVIVGDGKKIWVYDKELQQVTVRPMAGGLGNTPAILLAGSASLTAHFTVTDMGRQGKLEWVSMKPKVDDGGFRVIRIGFLGDQVRALVMVDSFGQTTRITLSDVHENAYIAPGRFRFTPPKGADVVGE
ncbi:MAG: outer membrane lipoprotein chaperone LolA [Pseudomonadota bacterium]|nr:outer membrane lipoprotein chaperone LolA [Pseudomonadota bacterium]